MRNRIAILAAVTALTAPVASHARLLVDAGDLRVSTERDAPCGAPVHLVIEADEPHLLSASAPQVQGTFDAARAMLEYECGILPSIRVSGRLRGLSRTSYQVDTTHRNDWLLAPEHAARHPSQAPARTESNLGPTSQFAVRSLTTGIGVDDAVQRVRREFGIEPGYDEANRELTVARGSECGDTRRTSLRPGAQCLTARFSDAARPRLSRLFYTQAVDRDQAQVIRRQLIDTFGQPEVDRTVERGGSPVLHLAWGDPSTVNRRGRTVERHELVARIRVSDDITVVRLNLIEPGLDLADAGDEPAHQAQF